MQADSHVTVETVLDASYNLEFDWSPGPGTNGNDGTYSSIEDPNIYTMIATVENTTCQLEIEVDMTDVICYVLADFNGDGIVNTADLSIFLTIFGTTCDFEPTLGNPCLGDLNYDGVINAVDLQMFLEFYSYTATEQLVNGACGF